MSYFALGIYIMLNLNSDKFVTKKKKTTSILGRIGTKNVLIICLSGFV